MNIAYQERDLKAITRKARIDYIFRVFQIILGKFGSWKNAYVLPKVKDEQTLSNIINRISWYLSRPNVKINIPVSPQLLNINIKTLESFPGQADYIHKIINTAKVNLVEKDAQHLSEAEVLLLNDVKKVGKGTLLKHFRKLCVIDAHYFSESEAAAWIGLNYSSRSKMELEELTKLSTRNFARLKEQHGKKQKAYCFVTGPSFDEYPNFKYEDNSFKVICNSIVKNKQFLEYIGKPDLLTCADPVFHFGPSLYADSFRKEAVNVVDDYGCFWTVPINCMGLLLDHFPDLKDKLIGLEQSKRFHIPGEDWVGTKQFANILTYSMIPMAAAMAKELYIIGADGRKSGEKYFWKHSKTAQFNDLMQSAFETHPSFFRDRDYKDYYEKHCADMESLLQFVEENGREVYSLTQSYIPALAKRKINDKSEK